MLDIDRKGNITLTRGDTAYIDVTGFKNKDGTTYYLQEGDKIYFRIRGVNRLTKELSLDLLNNKATLTLEPEDTEGFSFTAYRYEMELVTAIDEHYTFVADKIFNISKELEEHNGN